MRKIPWRRAWQPALGFLPGEPHGQRSLASCSPRGRTESDPTERLTHTRGCREARAALVLSRSLGLEAAPCSLQVAWARALSCPAHLRHRVAAWPHSAPYPSLCAWHSPRDPTPWEFSCQWRLLLAQSGPASARVLSVWGPLRQTRPRWPPAPLPAACVCGPCVAPHPAFSSQHLCPAVFIVMSDASSRAGAPGG